MTEEKKTQPIIMKEDEELTIADMPVDILKLFVKYNGYIASRSAAKNKTLSIIKNCATILPFILVRTNSIHRP